MEQASFLSSDRRPAEAEAVLREAIAAFPFDPELLTNLGVVLLIQGKPAEALEAADQACTLSPSNEWPHRVASYALTRLGRSSEALQRAERAVTVDRDSAVALRAVFEAQLGLGLVGEAAKTARLEAEMAPDEVWPLLDRARAALIDSDPVQAEKVLRLALSKAPDDADARGMLGVALRLQGREIEAIPQLNEAAGHGAQGGFASRQLMHAIDRYVGIWPILAVIFVGWGSLQVGASLKLGPVAALTFAGAATLAVAGAVIGLHRRRVRSITPEVWERYKAERRRTRGIRYGWVAFSFGTFLLVLLSVPAIIEVGSLIHSDAIGIFGVLWLLAALPAWRMGSPWFWRRYVLPRMR